MTCLILQSVRNTQEAKQYIKHAASYYYFSFRIITFISLFLGSPKQHMLYTYKDLVPSFRQPARDVLL